MTFRERERVIETKRLRRKWRPGEGGERIERQTGTHAEKGSGKEVGREGGRERETDIYIERESDRKGERPIYI